MTIKSPKSSRLFQKTISLAFGLIVIPISLTCGSSAQAEIVLGQYSGEIRCRHVRQSATVAKFTIESKSGGTFSILNSGGIEESLKFGIYRRSNKNYQFSIRPISYIKKSPKMGRVELNINYYPSENQLHGQPFDQNNLECTDLLGKRLPDGYRELKPVDPNQQIANLIPKGLIADTGSGGQGAVSENFYSCLPTKSVRRAFFAKADAAIRSNRPITAQMQTNMVTEAVDVAVGNACRMEQGAKYNISKAFDAIIASGRP